MNPEIFGSAADRPLACDEIGGADLVPVFHRPAFSGSGRVSLHGARPGAIRKTHYLETARGAFAPRSGAARREDSPPPKKAFSARGRHWACPIWALEQIRCCDAYEP